MNRNIKQISRLSPQQKLVEISKKLGNDGIQFQQGTTRVIYDSILMNGQSEFKFFKGANNRDFPFTNMGSSGNKLEVGEAMAIERVYLVSRTISINGAGELLIDDITPIDLVSLAYASGDLSIKIANSEVMKPISSLSFLPNFNKSSQNTLNSNFEFDTLLTIPPQVEFEFNLQTVGDIAIANTYLTLVVEGVGSILNVKGTL